jgi:hypothetical protein
MNQAQDIKEELAALKAENEKLVRKFQLLTEFASQVIMFCRPILSEKLRKVIDRFGEEYNKKLEELK